MKAFKVHNAEEVKQEVNLPAGTYTYSCRVLPVETSYTFRLDNQSFTFEGLTAGVLNKRMKHTFELTEAVSFFYLSNTIGDCIYEPQIEEGVFATTPGAHPLDFERLISEAGIEIDHEALSLYAKKADVSAEIKIQTDRIDSTVGNISNDVDGVKGDMTTISQTVNSITSTVTNHTTQISTFQQTVDQIYASIEDVGSGEFSYILQRIDQIEMKVGAPGQSGSIQLALDSIALTVYDEHGALLSQISQNGSDILIQGTQIDLRGATTINENFKILADGSMEAKNGKFIGEVNATSGSFKGKVVSKDALIEGALTTPFRDGFFRLTEDGSPIEVSTNGLQNNNCVVITGTDATWTNNFVVPFSSEYNGFRAIILNTDWGTSKALGSIVAFAPTGKYFQDSGEYTSTLVVNPHEGVELIGVGNGNVFEGWLILNKFIYGKEVSEQYKTLESDTFFIYSNNNYTLRQSSALSILTSIGTNSRLLNIYMDNTNQVREGAIKWILNSTPDTLHLVGGGNIYINPTGINKLQEYSITAFIHYNGKWYRQGDYI